MSERERERAREKENINQNSIMRTYINVPFYRDQVPEEKLPYVEISILRNQVFKIF